MRPDEVATRKPPTLGLTQHDLLPMVEDGSELNNTDVCFFCGVGSVGARIYFCDGFCQRAFCSKCLGSRIEDKDGEPWLCDECRMNVARCAFCGVANEIWHHSTPLLLNINLAQEPKTEKERKIRTR